MDEIDIGGVGRVNIKIGKKADVGAKVSTNSSANSDSDG